MILIDVSDDLKAEIGQRLTEGLREAQLRGEAVSREAIAIADQLNNTDAQPLHRQQWLTLKEASAHSGVPVRTLYDWRQKGLPSYRVGGRVRIDRIELDDFMSAERGESRQGAANSLANTTPGGED